jgi:nucleotide-binding universal stress UspA family protein
MLSPDEASDLPQRRRRGKPSNSEMNQVAPEHPGEDQPILIAYDGSDQAKAAIALAGRNLRTPRGAMVVSVFEPLGAIPFWGVPVARVPAPFIQEADDAAKKVSEEGAELARKAGFKATPAVLQGSPIWEKIVEAARSEGAGIIVIGSHGRSGVRYAAMGSVAIAVAHHAAIPVLIARAEDSDPGSRAT